MVHRPGVRATGAMEQDQFDHTRAYPSVMNAAPPSSNISLHDKQNKKHVAFLKPVPSQPIEKVMPPSAPPTTSSFAGILLKTHEAPSPSTHALHEPDQHPQVKNQPRTHFVEPEKPSRAKPRFNNGTKSAPVSPPSASNQNRAKASFPRSPAFLTHEQELPSASPSYTEEDTDADTLSDNISTSSETTDDQTDYETDQNGSEDMEGDTLSMTDAPVLLQSRPVSVTGILGTRMGSTSEDKVSPEREADTKPRKSLVFLQSPSDSKFGRDRSSSRGKDLHVGRNHSISPGVVSSVSTPTTAVFDTPRALQSPESSYSPRQMPSSLKGSRRSSHHKMAGHSPSRSLADGSDLLDPCTVWANFDMDVSHDHSSRELSGDHTPSSSSVAHGTLQGRHTHRRSRGPIRTSSMDKAEELAIVAERLLLHSNEQYDSESEEDKALLSDASDSTTASVVEIRASSQKEPSLHFQRKHSEVVTAPTSLSLSSYRTKQSHAMPSQHARHSYSEAPTPQNGRRRSDRSSFSSLSTSPRPSVRPSCIFVQDGNLHAHASAAVDCQTAERS